MNIQVINFEVCKDHYLMTKMIKKTKNNCITYTPAHLYKGRRADTYLIISKQSEEDLLLWCSMFELPLEKVIVLSNIKHSKFNSWHSSSDLEKDINFEKICRWLMCVIESTENLEILTNYNFKCGSIKKDHDKTNCMRMIRHQNHDIPSGAKILLFVKEKNKTQLIQTHEIKENLIQFYLKGISDEYEYCIIT